MSASFTLESSENVRLDGWTHVTASAGSARLVHADAHGEFVMENATGTLTVWTWTREESTIGNAQTESQSGDAKRATYRLVNANLTHALHHEALSLRAAPRDEGAITVSGATSGSGVPAHLLTEKDEVLVGTHEDPVFRAADEVSVRWKAGWAFVGDYAAQGPPVQGFPAWEAPRIHVEGPAVVRLQGGNVTFQDADTGEWHRVRLGNWSTSGPSLATGDVMRVESRTWARLIFEGTIGGFDVPAAGNWGLAAPSLAWTHEGRVTWSDASGSVRTPEGSRTFTGAVVTADGNASIGPHRAGALSVSSPTVYEGVGEFRAFAVDGRPVVKDAAPVAEAAFVASVLALLVTLFFEAPREFALRTLVGLYSRIRPSDVLEHPQRRRILDVVKDHPGLHMRELQRRVDGGWGALRAHLRMLAAGGHVRLERQGGYTLVYPTTAVAPGERALAIPHPVARAIFEALPEDGTPVPATELAERVGISRQLLRYHLSRLHKLDLVTLAEKDRKRWVERAQAGTPRTAPRRG